MAKDKYLQDEYVKGSPVLNNPIVDKLHTRTKDLGASGDKFTQFNRFRNQEGQDFATGGIAYIFFTKPDMNLWGDPNHSNLTWNLVKDTWQELDDSFLRTMKKDKKVGAKIFDSLDGGRSKFDHGPFIKLLSNTARNFEAKDTVLRTDEMAGNFVGHRLVLPGTTIDSESVDTVSINYNEYSDYSIMLLHKVWVDYINGVKRGTLWPKHTYIEHRVIDYVSSVYYFKTDETGRKIKFWSKLTGLFPTNVPYSAMSFHLGQTQLKDIDITYTYSFREDMKPEIIDEFKFLTGKPTVTMNVGKDERIGHYTVKGKKVSFLENVYDNWKSGVAIHTDKEGHHRLVFY